MIQKKQFTFLIALILAGIILTACQSGEGAEEEVTAVTSQPTAEPTEVPTNTPKPPANTPEPTLDEG
ncbi:MAG: hypothetical protein GY943_27665 [Chloroflexi bacterium]|nr:hypothetical protein [Chloroflexota bacterium]